tara:strand:- start:8030 stop:8695 length:666 start_codon:yes stop_codon:yes gene_type:complete
MFSFTKKRNTTKRLKLIIGGDGGVGKTSYFKALLGLNDASYKHDRHYNATPLNDFNMLTINFQTNKGEIIVDVWDTAGQEFNENDLRDAFISCSDMVLLFYDVQTAQTRHNIEKWSKRILSLCDSNIPIIVVGNKMDKIKDESSRKSMMRECRFPSLKNVKSILFSVRQRTTYNQTNKKGIQQILDPIEQVLQRYTNDKYLIINSSEIINSHLVNNKILKS